MEFLDVEFVLLIHARSIEEHGGDAGIRDPGLLESAVHLPRATFEGERLHATVPEVAAAYLFHLCMNHPFVDGNKRTALATAEVFLDLNGMEFAVSDDEAFEFTMAVPTSEMTKRQLVEVFLERCRLL